MKFCTDCKHYDRNSAYKRNSCTRKTHTEIDLVTHQKYTVGTLCAYSERRLDYPEMCGKEAKYFSPKATSTFQWLAYKVSSWFF
jgi:hypothetical protein